MNRPRPPADAPDAAVPDEVLLRDGLAGDAAALETLIARHRDGVFQFVRWFLDAPVAEAEDVTQDVFLQVLRSAGRFEGRAAFRTWLLAIARNLCHRRRRQRRRQCVVAAAGDGEHLLEIPDLAPSVLEALEAGDLQRVVRDGLAGLPAPQRTVLWLRDWEGLSYQDIALVLDIAEGTVRSRLHNARAALAARIRPIVEEAAT